MKTRLTFLSALLLGVAAPAAYSQPAVSATITDIAVMGGTDWGMGGTQVNGGNGPYTSQITIGATASGVMPYNFTFAINGVSIGVSNVYTFPSPGTYYITASVTDGAGHSATSVAVEYYATGIQVVSPLPNAILPAGSSVVVQAAAGIAFGAPAQVEFFVPPSQTPFAVSYNYPYSVIVTPQTLGGTQLNFYAAAYNPPQSPQSTPLSGLPGPLAAVAVSPTQSLLIEPPSQTPPTCVITTPVGSPAGTSPGPTLTPIPNYTENATAGIPVIVDATASSGFITKVELYINGVLLGTDLVYPYVFTWQPAVTGTYNITALAYDDKNNVIASTTSSGPTLTPQPTTVTITPLPSVAITSPGQGGVLNAGASATMIASAVDAVGILSVQFFQDGNFVGVATQPTSPGGSTYTVTFKPVQNINIVTGTVEPSLLTALATDTLGATQTSPTVIVTVTAGGSGGGGGNIGTPPTVSITSPTATTQVVVNTPVELMATANAPNGNVAQVSFLVDQKVLSTATQYPYSVSWTPQNLGTYQVVAEVTDNVGDVSNSPPVAITVVPEPPPLVSITSPTSGGIITAGSGVSVNVNATAPSGTITQVQFFANGASIGSATTSPYSVSWSPTSTGVYTLTAIATDNAGEQTTSNSSVVEVVPNSGGLGNSFYFGQYESLTDSGRFAFAVTDGKYGTFIGHSTPPSKASVTFYSDLAVSAGGTFSAASITGSAAATGVTGTLSPGQDQFIGTVTQGGSTSVAAGFYSGSITGQTASQVTAIVGYDGEIMVYVNDGSFTDAGDSTADSTGAFSITTASSNTIAGTVDPSTGFLSATLTGGPGGQILAARVSGGTFSDGVMRNISTRGQVGAGGNTMIAGFVVGGTAPKQLMVRAVGPTLASLGVPGAVAGTQLSVYSGNTLVTSNTDGWSTDPANETAVSNAEPLVNAFPLPMGSADSALVYTFPPGGYTAQVTGVGSDTGIGLVEVYDLDQLPPFSSQKLINVSTRGNVGTGPSILIGGIIINGSAPKRLLIRGAGPGLSALNVAGALTTPRLQLYNGSGQIIRENYSWQIGNDYALVLAAEKQTGAFAFGNNSADSTILIVLPPGNYTAELSGAGGSTGVGLVEVYEVP